MKVLKITSILIAIGLLSLIVFNLFAMKATALSTCESIFVSCTAKCSQSKVYLSARCNGHNLFPICECNGVFSEKSQSLLMNEQQSLRFSDFQNFLKNFDTSLNHEWLDCLTLISTAIENNDQKAYQHNVGLFDEHYQKLNLEQKAAIDFWVSEIN